MLNNRFLFYWLTFFKKQSLISKMRLLNFFGITAAMLIVLVVLSALYFWFARQTLLNNVLADARLLATNTAPMLAFHDKLEAEKLASIFIKNSGMLRIVVFDQQHNPFVDIRSGAEDYTPTPVQSEIHLISNDVSRFDNDCLLVYIPVLIEKERVGTIFIENSLKSISDGIIMFIAITSSATLFGIILSTVILKKLHIWALAPIFDMSKLAEQVAVNKSYHLRAKIDGDDEITSLAIRFNQMLERIEIWDKDLNEEIDHRRKSEQHLGNLARTDALTQLPNRFAFLEDMKEAVIYTIDKNEILAVLFCDLDDFKHVNDLHGHHCGDVVLQVTAKRLNGILRDTDRLYRLGGDEFAVLLTSVTEQEQVYQLITRLITKVGEKITITTEKQSITAKIGLSVGLAFCPADAKNYEDLLRRADFAMYAAKKDGKNKFRQFEKDMEK